MEERLPASAWPTLRQLQFLAALDAHGSFVRAAEAVGVTQPTLSAGIKELETALGVTLVERARTGVVLTPAGKEATHRASMALAQVEDLVRAVRSAGAPLTGVFRLGAIPTIAPFLLPRALKLLRAKFPELQLVLREDVTARLVEGLRARTLDAALIALPYGASGIEAEVIAEDEFLLICPKSHSLATKKSLTTADLVGEDLLLLDDGHCLRDHALSVCRLPQSRAAAEVGATSLHTLVQMVAGGMGVTLLPKLAADGGAASGAAVEMRRFDRPMIGRSIGIAWRAGGLRADEARLIAKTLRR
ncbi:MAG: hydrogen peroxide-inducible genes activator [Hyphomonadaceae bacterium]|nr:MAG: LysR family transcriptional regulator [Caulobacteraceae bacterium]MBT9446184.1 hydrogen peroxide-inducible genes activator [Hyphomonadaceae bacterium]TPW07130.1 MAG: LysR family transcriptional regulator [Alphaproteobacteria bacterium]